jgi:SAM-dependent methyltransferase
VKRQGGQGAQARYYARTADEYDAAHFRPGDEHFIALEYACGLFRALRVSSVLDVGAGTGRGSEFLAVRDPALRVVAVEPVPALLEASRSKGVRARVRAVGEELPFADASFDAVCASGVMHHVPNQETVVNEMMRVARRLIVISDANRFGQGPFPMRLIKLGLYGLGLWTAVDKLRTRGKGYLYSEGDGVFYSYSAFDSLTLLSGWADRISVMGTAGGRTGWTGPLLTSSSVMLAAMREPAEAFARPLGQEGRSADLGSPGEPLP